MKHTGETTRNTRATWEQVREMKQRDTIKRVREKEREGVQGDKDRIQMWRQDTQGGKRHTHIHREVIGNTEDMTD